MTYLSLFLIFLSLISCSQKGAKIAAIANSNDLIASTEMIPIASSGPLTREDVDRLYRFYPKTLERIQGLERLSVQDIKNMTRAGLDDEVIKYEISVTRSKFYLTPSDEETLAQAGVSNRVIRAMKDTIDAGD